MTTIFTVIADLQRVAVALRQLRASDQFPDHDISLRYAVGDVTSVLARLEKIALSSEREAA